MKQSKQLLEILKEPHPMLHHKCGPIALSWGADWLITLAQNMIYTMRAVKGVGIAAPQIGEPLQLAIAVVDKVPLVLINPEIIEHSDEQASMTEGCLSCPNESVRIDRYVWVKVKYNDLKGKEKTILLDGINAIIVQHECAHLNGVLITDYKNAA